MLTLKRQFTYISQSIKRFEEKNFFYFFFRLILDLDNNTQPTKHLSIILLRNLLKKICEESNG